MPYANKKIAFGIRPEDVGSSAAEQVEGAPRIKAKVDIIEPMGPELYIYLNTGGYTFISRVDAHHTFEVGRIANLAVDVGKAHFFDPDTEQVII